MSIATLKKKTAAKYNNSSVNQRQFALNGTHRNQGFIGQTSFSRTNLSTPASGVAFHGYGTCCSTYKISELATTSINSTEDSSVVKPSVLSSKGMIEKRTMWARRSYPFSSTKPGDDLNLSSGADYITHKRQQTINDTASTRCASSSTTNNSKTACCVPFVKTAKKIGVATSQGDYILQLISPLACLDISSVTYNRGLTNRPVNTC
jgi:hypothetical protein